MDSSTNAYPSTNIGGDGETLFSELMTNTSDTVNGPSQPDTIVSSATAFFFKVFVYVSMSAVVSIIGIVTNIINITVFIRQGIFTDGGSPTLLGLAVSDLCCVISMLWLCACYSFVLADPPGLPWRPWDIMYITGGWPHLMFAQITRMITAYVAFERCMCVVFPFKVKTLFTPQRSIVVIAAVFVCCGCSYSPVFIAEQLKIRTDPITNTTRLVLVSAPSWRLIVDIMYSLNSIFFNIASVAIVFVCTMITVSRVKLSSAWRKSMETGNSSKQENSQQQNKADTEGKAQPNSQMSKSKMQKEKKLVRMIILISITFLLCYSPDFTLLIVNAINPDIRVLGKYDNLASIMYSFIFLMETINSSINIIIYYTMSTKYREEFRSLFGMKSS